MPIRPSQAVNFINQPGGIVGLNIDSCRPEDAGAYSLTVTNKLGEVASKAIVEVGITITILRTIRKVTSSREPAPCPIYNMLILTFSKCFEK